MEREVFIWLIPPDHSSSLREAMIRIQSKNLEAETEAQTLEECCLLDHSPGSCSACLLKKPKTCCERWHHPQWTDPSHIKQQLRKSLTVMAIGQSNRWNSLAELPSFQVWSWQLKPTMMEYMHEHCFQICLLKIIIYYHYTWWFHFFFCF